MGAQRWLAHSIAWSIRVRAVGQGSNAQFVGRQAKRDPPLARDCGRSCDSTHERGIAVRLVAVVVRKRVNRRRRRMVMRTAVVVMARLPTARRPLRMLMMGAATDMTVHEHSQQTNDGNDNAPHLHINGVYTYIHSPLRIIAPSRRTVNRDFNVTTLATADTPPQSLPAAGRARHTQVGG